MKNGLNEQQIEEMAFEIRRFLIDNRLWSDACICFNGKAFATFSQFEKSLNFANLQGTKH